MIPKFTSLAALTMICIILFAGNFFASAQTNAYRFRYTAGRPFNSFGTLYETAPIVPPPIQPAAPAAPLPKTTITALQFNLRTKFGKIKINEGRDSLTMKPWYNPPANPPLSFTTTVGVATNVAINPEADYVFAINWPVGTIKFKIPFHYQSFVVTSIPFRINLKKSGFQSDFLNANVAYMFIFGRTRFYKSKFLDPRSRYWGIGPFIGASKVEEGNGENKKEVFGFNYGVNAIYKILNINLSVALGAETTFTSKENAFNPYLGFGLGIKLIDIFDPEDEAVDK